MAAAAAGRGAGSVPQVHCSGGSDTRYRPTRSEMSSDVEAKHMYDMKNLGKFKRLGELAPEAFKAFVAFD